MGPRGTYHNRRILKNTERAQHSRIMVRNITAHYCIVWFICVLVYKGERAASLRNPRRLRFFILLLECFAFTFSPSPPAHTASTQKGVKLKLAVISYASPD